MAERAHLYTEPASRPLSERDIGVVDGARPNLATHVRPVVAELRRQSSSDGTRTATSHHSVSIADYGFLSDCRSAALVSTGGSIDWLCWPRFDSPSVFAKILDSEIGGAFAIIPTEPYSAV